MADRRISELTNITGADVDDDNDELVIVDASAGQTRAITRRELFNAVTSLRPLDSRTLYVDASGGSDSNDGRSSGNAFATIQAAVDALANLYLADKDWTIELAAGTYAAFSVDGVKSARSITIKGPDTTIAWDSDKWIADSGTDRIDMTPTAIVNGSSGEGVGVAREYTVFRFQNILFDGFDKFLSNNKSSVALINVHVKNCTNGASVLHGGFISIVGGHYDGSSLGGDGYSGFYNATCNIIADTLADAALFDGGWGRGILMNEGAQGHLDRTRIHDCTEAGLVVKRGAGACNTKNMEIYRNAVGVLAQGSGWFNNNIDFGTGADVNTVNVRPIGGSPEQDALSQDTNSRTMRDLEIETVAAHTGTTSETTLYTSPPIRDWAISEGGPRCKVEIIGESSLTGSCTIRIDLDSTTTAFVTMNSGAGDFKIEADIFYVNSSSQRSFVTLTDTNGVRVNYLNSSLSLKNVAHNVNVTAELDNSGDSVTFRCVNFATNAHG